MKIEDILDKLDIYEDENEKILKDYFKNKTSLEIIEEITKHKYNTKKCYLAIKTLIKDIDKDPYYITSSIYNISKNIIENYDMNFLKLFIANISNNEIDFNKIVFNSFINYGLTDNLTQLISKANDSINNKNLSEMEDEYFGLSFEFDLQKSETYYLNIMLQKFLNNKLVDTDILREEFKKYFPYNNQTDDVIISKLLQNEGIDEVKSYLAIKSLINNSTTFNPLNIAIYLNYINNLKNDKLDKLLIFHLLNNGIISNQISEKLNPRGEYLFNSLYNIYKNKTEEEKNELLITLEKDFINGLNNEDKDDLNNDINDVLNKLTNNTKNNIAILNNLMNKYKLSYNDLLYKLLKVKSQKANMYYAISTLLYCCESKNIKIDPYYVLDCLVENDYVYTFIFLILLNLKVYNFFGYEFDKYKLVNIFSKKFPYIKNDNSFVSSLDIINNSNKLLLEKLKEQAANECLKLLDWDVDTKENNNFNIKEFYSNITDNSKQNYEKIKEYFKDMNDGEIISNLFYYNLDYLKTYQAIVSIIKESNDIKFKDIKKESLINLYKDNQKLFDLLILHFYIKYGSNDKDFNDFLNSSYCKHIVISFISRFNKISKNEQEMTLYELEKRYINSDPKKEVSLLPVAQKNKLNIRESDIKKIEKYGRLLNIKEYKETPTIGREKELKSLIITLAQDKTCPIIVGESGVGKTALVDELSYRIQNGDVPDFLKNQLILEVSPSEVVSGCKYVGMFEQNMKELLDICKKYNILLFIDEIHEMYGTGSGEKKETDMADIIKRYISRDNGRIIGTTTKEEYLEHFSNDALKRRFDKIEVEEPTKVVLYQIVEKVIEDFSNKNNIYFETEEEREEVIKVIVESTSKLKPYNDKLCNPDLSIKLIDKAYAYAKIENSKFISKDNFISSFEDTKWLYDSTIKSAINRLKNIKEKTDNSKKCLILNINDYLK